MNQRISRGNRLLDILAPADFALLAPHLKEVAYDQGTLVQEADRRIERVYFPHSGMISLLAVMRAGEGIEAASVGREGAVNFMAGLGSRRSASRAIVQVAGTVSQISVASFRQACESSDALRDLAVRYNDVQIGLFQQTVGCNALHPIEQRICRWLLQTRDRSEGDDISLTQEFFSEMLGVQRTSVTAVARLLQNDGLIKYRRGQIVIVDRAGLERKSCSCYDATQRKAEAIFAPDT